MKKGFTLVELLVSISLIMLVSGISIAGWTNFRASRALENNGLELTIFLRETKSKAVNGEKPIGASCDFLESYQVEQTVSGLRTFSVCINSLGNQVSGPAEETNISSSSLSIASTGFPINFKSLEGSIESEATFDLSHDRTSMSGTITISQAGEITWQRD